ncbi:MAG: hypothetical protein PHT94_04460 [Candidatus Nanoarchaeia archaeon]|nr:hypothetical protein [Candidatus Nanoarchaeia archaeon]
MNDKKYEYFDFSSLNQKDDKKIKGLIKVEPTKHADVNQPILKKILMDNILEDKNIISRIAKLQNQEEQLKKIKMVILPKFLYDRDLVYEGKLSFSELEDDFDDDVIATKKEFMIKKNDIEYKDFFKLILLNDMNFDNVVRVIRREMFQLKDILLLTSNFDQLKEFADIGINLGYIAADYNLDKYIIESKDKIEIKYDDLHVEKYVNNLKDNISKALELNIPLILSSFKDFSLIFEHKENLYRVFDNKFIMRSLSTLRTISNFNLRHESISLFLFDIDDNIFTIKTKKKYNDVVLPVPNNVKFDDISKYIQNKLKIKINIKKLGNVVFEEYEKVFYLYMGYSDEELELENGEYVPFRKIREIMLTSPDSLTNSFYKSLEIYKKMNIDND